LGAAIELDPGAVATNEGVRFPICSPRPLADLFTTSGLKEVEIMAIDILTPFKDFEDYGTLS
jgi:hypothetical protein